MAFLWTASTTARIDAGVPTLLVLTVLVLQAPVVVRGDVICPSGAPVTFL
jgi:hypothetical protein